MVAKSRNVNSDKTVICGTRYGNVMASRGSVIPLFVDQIKVGKAIMITDRNMTRFMMTLEDAVDRVLYAFEHGNNGDIFVQKAPAATIETLAIALKELLSVEKHPVNVIERAMVKSFMKLCLVVKRSLPPLTWGITIVFHQTCVILTMENT